MGSHCGERSEWNLLCSLQVVMAFRERARMSSVRPCCVYVYDREGAACDYGDVSGFVKKVLHSDQEVEVVPAHLMSVAVRRKWYPRDKHGRLDCRISTRLTFDICFF
jgi:hypothetical protein